VIRIKNTFFLIFFLFPLLVCSQDIEKQKFKVLGNCNMCKSKIESTVLSIEGVTKAQWDVNTKILLIKFKSDITSLNEIQKEIADIGYDNEGYKAADVVYHELHYCCQYERVDLK